MKNKIKKLIFSKNNISELFFPVFSDFNSINTEIDKKLISNNTWDLVNDEDKYTEVLEAINDSKENRDNENISDVSFKSVILK